MQSMLSKEHPLDVLLWEVGPPGMVPGATRGADDGTNRYRDVGIPSMWVYMPNTPAPKGGRIALVTCARGGYTHLTRLPGADGLAELLCPRKVVVVALRYRTAPPSPHVENDAMADGKRAIRLLRHNAAQWGINPKKVGLLGWSAGGNLSLNVASHFDQGNTNASETMERHSCRPDFSAFLSPWPCDPPHAIEHYPITKDAPPAFIAGTEDDDIAPISFAKSIANSYGKAGVPHKTMFIESGGHEAITIGAPGEGGKWAEIFWSWLKEIGVRD